ncbi:hypothetical protein [Lentzea kentuckyensis]|uniref:nSTAND1 domain-containing NTPase n=1 Tax=Lentzea kentuckyensis TaxID=360086 RepID=UPI000A3C1F0E|nr:hypothetical protein [Lentzea kentuckyensis]
MSDRADEADEATGGETFAGTRNVVSGQVGGSVLQARDIHVHVPRRLRLLLDSAGSNYLTENQYEPDEQTPRRREELADQLVRLAIESPGNLDAAISGAVDAAEDAPSEPWVLEEAVALLSLVEQRLSEQQIAQQAHTDVTERMAVELMQLRRQVDAHRAVYQEAASGEDAEEIPPPAPGECPYPGLSAFTASQTRWFFGREELTARLVRRLAVVRAGGTPLFVVGVSGAGKSSLLRAGLVPALVNGDVPVPGSENWPYVQLRPGARPFTELVTRIALLGGIPAGAAVDDVRADPARFAVLVRQAALAEARKRDPDGDPGCVVVIVDQFEEIFTLCQDGEERAAFIAALRAAADRVENDDTTPAALVVLGLRADFFPSCADEPGLATILQDNQFLVGPMSTAELRSAVERPAEAVGITLDSGLADLVVGDLADRTGYQPGALPLLGYALQATWTKRRGHTMTLASYQEAGGVRGAVATAAEMMFTAMSEPEQLTTRKLLLRLVAVGDGVEDTRRQVPKSALTDGDDNAVTVLNRLVITRLVTVAADTVEIAHEALIRAWPRLAEWLDADRAGLLVHRRLTDATQTWLSLHKDAGSLYRGAQLADLRAWLAERDDRSAGLSPVEREFVEASVAAEEADREFIRRTNRRLRRLVAGLATLTVITLVAGVIAVWQQQVADSQRSQALAQQAIAASREYAAGSLSASDTDPRRSLLLAAAAWSAAPTEESRGAFLRTQTEPYLGTLGPVSDRLWHVALAPDGTLAALATSVGTVTLWDTAAHRQVAQLTGPDGNYPSVAFSPDGRTLVTSNDSKQPEQRLRLWDVRTHKLVRSLPGSASSVAFSSDGSSLVTAWGSRIVQWDLATARPIRTYQGTPGIFDIALSHDGSLIAAAGTDGGVHLWETATGKETAVLSGHTKAVFGVDFSRDGTTLVSSSEDGTVRLWNVAERRPAAVPVLSAPWPGVVEFSRKALFSPDGRHVVAGMNRSKAIQWWRVADGAVVRTNVGHTQSVTGVAFSRDGNTLLSGGLDGAGILWKVRATFLDQPAPVHAVAFSPDGRVLASSSGRTVTLWDPERREQVRVLTVGDGSFVSLSFSPDSSTLVTSQDGAVRLWSVKTGTLVRTFPLDSGQSAYYVTFSPDGNTLAAIGGTPLSTFSSTETKPPLEYIVRQWNVASGDVLVTNSYRVTNAAVDPYPSGRAVFSPDSTMFAVPLTNGSIEFRQARTGERAGELVGHQDGAVSLAFTKDGTMLASGGSDRTVRLWDVATRKQIGAQLTGHNGVVRGVAFLPDGRTLASVSDYDLVLRLWDVPSRTPLAAVRGSGSFDGIAVQPGTGLIATAGLNNVVGIWNPDPASVKSQVCSILGGQQSVADAWKAVGRDPGQAPRCEG